MEKSKCEFCTHWIEQCCQCPSKLMSVNVPFACVSNNHHYFESKEDPKKRIQELEHKLELSANLVQSKHERIQELETERDAMREAIRCIGQSAWSCSSITSLRKRIDRVTRAVLERFKK